MLRLKGKKEKKKLFVLLWGRLVFNIEVFNACQMPFGLSKKFFFFGFWGHFTKTCSAKFPPFTVKASPKSAFHKIQWLQFVNRNMVGVQSRHSSIHFQIIITPVILTMEFQHGTVYNFDLASTTICECGFSK